MKRRRAVALVIGVALLTGSVAALSSRSAISVLRTFTIDLGPNALSAEAIDESTGHLFVGRGVPFVGSGAANKVSMLDAATGRVLRTVAVAGMPGAVAVVARYHRILVLPYPLDVNAHVRIAVLDARSGALVGTVPTSEGATMVAVDQRTGRAFVIDVDANSMSLLDVVSLRVVRTVLVDPDPTRGPGA